MQRQRKRDLNLKPNRVLDKRSSRGMIYENEELRHRTLAIADDVDRGHDNIRKLRRENDHLKRELWELRDECEKLEEILKRVMSTGNLNPTDLAMMLDTSTDPSLHEEGGVGGNCSRKGSQDGEALSEFIQTMFCSDKEDTGSVIHHVVEQHPFPQDDPGRSSTSPSPIIEQPEVQPGPYLPSTFGKFIGPDLEPLKEENESISQSLAALAEMTINQSNDFNMDEYQNDEPGLLPDPNQIFDQDRLECNPVIQITPASTSTSTSTPTPTTPNTDITDSSIIIQDGGCIAQIPTQYEVTSQLHIQPETKPLPFKKKSTSTLKLRHPSDAVGHPRKPPKSSSIQNIHHRHSLHSSSNGPRFCPSCYQSEPTLDTKAPEWFGLGFPSCPTSQDKVSLWWWTTGLENVLGVGLIQEGGHIQAQEVVDELEAQWDISLERVRGIRLLDGVIFLRLRDPEALSMLLEAFGTLQQPLKVKNTHVTFHHGSQGCTELRLVGLGPEVPDTAVVSMLNGYGQVVGAVERIKYKGVEVWEREVKLHQVIQLDANITLGGYTVSVQILTRGNLFIPLDKSQTSVDVNVNQTSETTDTPVTNQQSQNENNIAESKSSILHKPVGRCASSNPRLELGPSPSSPIPQQRTPSASICVASVTPEDHPGRIFQKNPNLHKTSAAVVAVAAVAAPLSSSPKTASVSSAPNLNTAQPKKPLSRLLKSSPGSLVPPNPSPSPEIAASVPTFTSIPEKESLPSPHSLRAAFYRRLSIEPPRPRRGSTSSNAADNNNLPPVSTKDWRRTSSAFYSRFGTGSQGGGGHQPLSQMNSSSSSHNSHVYETRGGAALGNGEPLPWCGCWGNGCI